METELQEAERFAREFLDSPWALFRTRLLARVFLAQQARLAEVERERDAWKLKAESEGIRIKWRDEERADAERKATELERERDEWRTAWDGVNTHRNQLREALAAAERKATELERERDAAIEARDIHNEMLLAAYRNNAEAYAARNAAERKATEAAREQQKAWVAGVRWMCEKFAEAPEVVRAAFTPDKGDVVFYCGERIENIAATLYPAPTEREATPPQAAPEPVCDQCLQPLAIDEARDHDNPRRHTIRGCNRALGRAMRRIVETGRASGRGE